MLHGNLPSEFKAIAGTGASGSLHDGEMEMDPARDPRQRDQMSNALGNSTSSNLFAQMGQVEATGNTTE